LGQPVACRFLYRLPVAQNKRSRYFYPPFSEKIKVLKNSDGRQSSDPALACSKLVVESTAQTALQGDCSVPHRFDLAFVIWVGGL
jgi:hypothetical protein